MADTRKHRVEVRDELDKALNAALGQPVPPTEPVPEPAPSTATTSFIAPGSTLAGFTFGHANPPDAD